MAPILILLSFSLLSVSGSAAAAQSQAFVFTTDFSTGSLSAIDLDGRAVARDVATGLCTDARLRWSGGLLYVVNRFGCDNVLVLDPAKGFAVVRQFSTGNGSNPADIVFLSPTKAYVTRYDLASLLIVNPATGGVLGQISLAPYADADGIPEMDHMVRVGNRVFVAVQRLDRKAGFVPADSSLAVVIDAAADTVLDVNPALPGRQAIRLTGTNPFTDFAFDPASGRLLVGCVGRYGVLDGGIEWVDPAGLLSLGFAVTEAALAGDVTAFAWNGRQRSYAIVSDASFNTLLVSWSAQTGTRTGTLSNPGGFSLADCAVNDRGELYLCNNSFSAPGVFVYSTATDLQIAGPLGTGLPPMQVVFDDAGHEVSVITSSGFEIDFWPPRPNPARANVRLALVLGEPAEVRVEVFDVTGRRVRILVSGPLPAGRNDMPWDLQDEAGRRVQPGLFFLRAGVGQFFIVWRLGVLY